MLRTRYIDRLERILTMVYVVENSQNSLRGISFKYELLVGMYFDKIGEGKLHDVWTLNTNYPCTRIVLFTNGNFT
jgi:hypothetical protein